MGTVDPVPGGAASTRVTGLEHAARVRTRCHLSKLSRPHLYGSRRSGEGRARFVRAGLHAAMIFYLVRRPESQRARASRPEDIEAAQTCYESGARAERIARSLRGIMQLRKRGEGGHAAE